MARTNTKTIRVEESLYNKLLDYKKGKSFNVVIDQMTSYFLKTGINPESVRASPFLDFQNSIERIIKIIKAQEKQYFSKIGEITRYIETEKKDYLSTHLDEVKSAFIGESLTTEELNVFLGEFENLKKKNERLNSLAESQKIELENLKSSANLGKNNSGNNLIFWELFENFFSEGNMEKNNFVVSRHQLQMYERRLKELTNVR